MLALVINTRLFIRRIQNTSPESSVSLPCLWKRGFWNTGIRRPASEGGRGPCILSSHPKHSVTCWLCKGRDQILGGSRNVSEDKLYLITSYRTKTWNSLTPPLDLALSWPRRPERDAVLKAVCECSKESHICRGLALPQPISQDRGKRDLSWFSK